MGTSDAPIKVLLADDHTLFRQGLAKLLASYEGLEVVGDTTNDEGAVALAERTKPDVVIMQVQMPFERARESLRRMRGISPPPKIIITTMLEEPRIMRDLLELGVKGYVLKSSSSEHLRTAIRTAVLSPDREAVVMGLPSAMLEESAKGSDGVLSARELEILLLAARGMSNNEIAARLYLASGTVKRHLANIYAKMGVGSRTEAARKALQEEWFTVDEIIEA